MTSPTTLKENGEYKLKKILFEDYDTEIRPVKEHAKPVKVKFEMALNQILEVVKILVLSFVYYNVLHVVAPGCRVTYFSTFLTLTCKLKRVCVASCEAKMPYEKIFP